MKVSKRYIPVLISIALLSLIGLQIMWLFFVYENKKEEFIDNTREAVLATTMRYQEQEDAKFIVKNMDSLLVTENIIGNDSKEDIRVIVSNIKDQLKIDTFVNQKIHKEIRVIKDTATSTTVIKLNSNGKMLVQSESHGYITKIKAHNLQKLFLKMASNTKATRESVDARVDSHEIRNILHDELLKRGINISPEFGVLYWPSESNRASIDYHVVVNTPEYVHILPAMVTLPLFANDLFGGSMYLKVGYFKTSKNFVLKQMAGLLALSLSITILIGFVMIYIFRRMLSQEKLHQLKNDFINNMTHELKTPIATISLALDAINNPQVKNDEVKFNNYTRILKEENQKLNTHVERVLQMALLDKGKLHLSKKTFNLTPIIQSAIESYALQIEKQKATILFDKEQSPGIISGDEIHLLSVFTNLLDNALKYSKENCVVEIKLNQNANEIVVTFKDNGIGIDNSLKDKVFEKFFRVQGGNLHDVKGFGLGLSYVYSIITSHGGTIELNSEKNMGSEFIIKLPSNVG